MYRVNSAGRLLALFSTSTTNTATSHFSHPNTLFSSLAYKNPFRQRRVAYKNDLPPELSRNMVRLTCDSPAIGGACNVYVVGSVHYSEESRRQVKAVVNFLKPQVMFLELCCRGHHPDIFEPIEYGEPVSEFHVAYEEATKYRAKVVLGDRCTAISLERLFDQLYRRLAEIPPWHMTKRFFSVLFQMILLLCPKFLSGKEGTLSYSVWKFSSEIKKGGDRDKMPALVNEWLSRDFPDILETMIVERDQYMSARLLEVARKHNSVVAVVGRAHLPGLQKYWKQHIEAKELLSVSSKGRVLKWGSYCFSSYMLYMIQKVLS